MITPMLTNVDPQSPTTDSSTLPIEGCLAGRRSACGSTPYDTSVTEANSASTLRNPRTVARPTSSRRRARREYTLAPSMPRNTNVVTSIVSFTWSNSAPTVALTAPEVVREGAGVERQEHDDDEDQDRHQLRDRDDPVDHRGLAHAARDQEVERQTPAEASTTASIVLPCPRPGKNSPSVVIVNTMKKTFPPTLLAQ